jgi:hypothetical protein
MRPSVPDGRDCLHIWRSAENIKSKLSRSAIDSLSSECGLLNDDMAVKLFIRLRQYSV